MPTKLNYLDNLKEYLRLDPEIENDVVRELNSHIEDKRQELKESGLSEEEATATATKLLGSSRLVAKQMYEVYSQGSWQQALIAALPHFLIAGLFALRWWHHAAWLIVVLAAAICTVIYGWCHGKPAWLFPWLSYCLIPVLVVGTMLVYLRGAWAWFAVIAYIPLALLVAVPITKKTIKRDWLFASLMLFPIPIVLSWILALGLGDKIPWYKHLYETAPLITLTFAMLAITVAVFIRVRQRWAKVGILLVLDILILAIIALAVKNAIAFWGWLLLILLSLILLLGPALIERKIREG
jgi:hypothetical protein